MKRALVLNAASAWGAYQAGALKYLHGEGRLEFDLFAGTGIGAFNAALAAAGEFEALESFWQRFRRRRLVGPNLRTPWRGVLTKRPAVRFLTELVTEDRLTERGARLVVTTFDLQSGREHALTYPGAELPLERGLAAALATPGLVPAVRHDGEQLVAGSMAYNIPLRPVLRLAPEEVVVVAGVIRRHEQPPQRYPHWRAILARWMSMNEAHDVFSAIAEAKKDARAAVAFRKVRAELERRVGSPVAGALDTIPEVSAPTIRVLTPSRTLPGTVWSFRRRVVEAGLALGYADAQAAFRNGNWS